ncbi:MAG: S8 family serine peptidase [Bacteroidetes bacterium]|nr:S8 family serine peptidase [Bacteroidota bacterium]
MKQFTLFNQKSLLCLFVIFFSLLPFSNHAQFYNTADFVLLSGNGGAGTTAPGALGYGIIMNAGANVNGGNIGAHQQIKTNGSATISANMFSTGKVILSNSNIISGRITAANTTSLSGNILTAGTGSQLSGNIDVNGNILVSSGIVSGNVTHPLGTTYTGPTPGANILATPVFPTLPSLPAITVFPAAGTTHITNTLTVSPGNYGNLTLSGNKTITFNGPGVYVFNSMSLTQKNNFVFNFQNSLTGVIKIYVHGDMKLDKIATSLINGGSASRIFYESHGNGLSSPTGKDAIVISNAPAVVGGYTPFHGTVYAPYAAVSVGSSSGGRNFLGSIYSGTQIHLQLNINFSHVAYFDCSYLNVNAGIDTTLDCNVTSYLLPGVTNALNPQYRWSTSNGILGVDSNTATPSIEQSGTYILKVTDLTSTCIVRDTVIINFTTCILPGYVPPPGGKTVTIIGPDLTSLKDNYSNANPNEDIFIIENDSVWVEIIYNHGKYVPLYNLLIASPFLLTNFIDNGTGNRIITTLVKIAHLDALNNLNATAGDSLINFVRPLYRPIVSVGVAYTLGDIAQNSNLARGGFDTGGEGIKIGVLSNSYNTQPGNKAQADVLNGDLPGPGNPNGHTLPVQVIDYTRSTQSDEGRAMLQLVHDIAPKAELAFRTGFISAGNMAQGIRQLQQNGCQIEVDDITYITEPYFQDGMIATAVNEVKNLGVSYFTAAGNFGERAYESIYSPISAPGSLTGTAHDFGGGDRFQSITLTPGSYMLVLQWEDGFYSIEQPQTGTQNDLDVYLTNNSGNTLFGFNRNNLGGDPMEVLPFTVTQNTTTNILITRAAGSGNSVHFKYIFFRGSPTINEYPIGTSTIVGQANALGAITLGAVSYLNTPSNGVNPPTKASFSSTGGTLMGGLPRQKPDLCAPNGGNTTVDLGGVDIENDLLPNFFGTSAAAPHAAGAAALIMSAKMKFYGTTMSPDDIKNSLTSNAIEMYTPGFDFLSGYGLLDAFACVKSFAEPSPKIDSLEIPNNVTPGDSQFIVTVHGEYLTNSTKVLVDNDTIPTNYVDDQHVTAVVSAFSGNPPVRVCTPSKSALGNDGGCSTPLYFDALVRKQVVVTTHNKTKKYGQNLPVFTDSISIDGIPIELTSFTLSDLGLDTIDHVTPASEYSNVGTYFIQPLVDVNDSSLQVQFEYTFNNGILFVEKLPLTIKPNNKIVQFGDQINGEDFTFQYIYNSANIPSTVQAAFIDTFQQTYEGNLLKEVALIDDREAYEITVSDGNGGSFSTYVQLSTADLVNLALLSGSRAIANGSRGIANGSRAIANNTTPDTTHVIDLFIETLVDYNNDGAEVDFDSSFTLMNGSRGIANGSRGIVNSEALIDGSALVNGSRAIANGSRAIANGSRAIANGEVTDNESNSNIAVIIHESDLDAVEDTSESFELFSLCGITGLTAGEHFIIPGAFTSSNFAVSYDLGTLNINPYPLNIEVVDTEFTYGTTPQLRVEISGFQYEDSTSSVFSNQPNTWVDGYNPLDAGTYNTYTGSYYFHEGTINYTLNYINGEVIINPSNLYVTADDETKPYGFEIPELTYSFSGFQYSDNESMLNCYPDIYTFATYDSYPGIYDIYIGLGGECFNNNYNFIFENGELIIEEPPTCGIYTPSYLPSCGSNENSISADAPNGYGYEWNFNGTGTSVSEAYNSTVWYNVSPQGIDGEFAFYVYAPITEMLVCSSYLPMYVNCYNEYCTYTQEDWGDTTRLTCNGDSLKSELASLLSIPLIAGHGVSTITFDQSDTTCLISKLPASNAMATLTPGNEFCPTLNPIFLSGTKFLSELLGNTIALMLSVRNNPALGDLQINNTWLATYEATACINGVPANMYSDFYEVGSPVVSYLGYGSSVNMLLTFANLSLAGELGVEAPTLAEFNTAVKAILDGFHNCRILDDFYYGPPAKPTNTTTIAGEQSPQLTIYPNPTTDKTKLTFTSGINKSVKLELYNVSGKLMSTLYENVSDQETNHTIEIDCSQYASGLYFVRLNSGDEVNVKKLVVLGRQ